MTISSEVRKAGPFSGNDVTTAFSFSFKVFSTADVLAVSADSLGLETDLTEGVDYTVSLNANQNANPGGTVTLTSPLATGYTLVLTSQVQNLQPTDLTNQGGFYPAVINAALDRATIQIQQLSEKVDRSAKLPITRTEDVDALLSDIVVLADNLSSVNTVAGSIGSVNTVAGVSADVTTVAGVSAQVATVAAISTDVSTVAGVASGVPTVAASAANVDTVAGSIASVNTVSANVVSVNTVAADIADVSTVAGNIANINAAVADLPALSAKVSKTGDTMTGPLSVPAGASGAQVPQAQEVAVLASTQLAGHRNRIINGNFSINQRGYVSGTATSGANQYTLDRWRVVTSGQNLTFSASGNGNQVTAPAGGIEQVIEGANIEGGTYVINWIGTATCTVNGSARAKGEPFTLTANTNATIRFSSGTVSKVQLEPGTAPTVFEHRLNELQLCQRYTYVVSAGSKAALGASGVFGYAYSLSSTDAKAMITTPVQLRATPAVQILAGGAAIYTAGGSVNVGGFSPVDVNGCILRCNLTGMSGLGASTFHEIATQTVPSMIVFSSEL